MSNEKRLVQSIIDFLGDQLHSGKLSADAAESLEVAIQCLESAYGIDSSDPSTASALRVSQKLVDIFGSATKDEQVARAESDLAEAERLKNEGNNLMRTEKYLEAVDCYARAITIDDRNAIYYCNRAAAYSKLNQHAAAIEDCRRAIEIDPSYSKAYGRMGLAHCSLNQNKEAKVCFEKAVQLDPQNESYLNNLKITEEKLRETNIGSQDGASAGQAASAPGFGLDLGALLNNPALMNMATLMMADPNMQQLMGTLMAGGSGASSTTGAPAGSQGAGSQGTPGSSSSSGGFEALLQAGQQLAAQMQASNPTLVERLRRQMNPDNNPNNDQEGSTGSG